MERCRARDVEHRHAEDGQEREGPARVVAVGEAVEEDVGRGADEGREGDASDTGGVSRAAATRERVQMEGRATREVGQQPAQDEARGEGVEDERQGDIDD